MDAAVTALLDQLPPDVVSTDEVTLERYRYDWTRDPASQTPLAVVRPRSTEQVSTALRWASAHRVPVVPRGSGTSLSAGARGVAGGIVLSMERMTAIRVDPALRVAVAQPGALNAAVKAAAAEYGLWYAPDPSSFELCSIGGNVATNAGGLCCVKYGVTREYVAALQVVLADGQVVRLGSTLIKDVAGLSLRDLFVGSEGTLGVVTEVTVRLLPTPNPPTTMVATFATTTAAAEAVVAIVSRVRPSMLELMDNLIIRAVDDLTSMGLDRTAGALLLARSDLGGAAGEAEIAVVQACCEAAGAAEVFATTDLAEGDALVAGRRLALVATEKRGVNLLEDTGVPVPRLPELLTGIEKIAANYDIEIAVVAHAGDGNTHPVIIYPPGDEAAAARAREAFGAVMELAISLGGTITGEHGVGRLKAPYLAAQVGEDVVELARRVKAALDPLGILNPGVSCL